MNQNTINLHSTHFQLSTINFTKLIFMATKPNACLTLVLQKKKRFF